MIVIGLMIFIIVLMSLLLLIYHIKRELTFDNELRAQLSQIDNDKP